MSNENRLTKVPRYYSKWHTRIRDELWKEVWWMKSCEKNKVIINKVIILGSYAASSINNSNKRLYGVTITHTRNIAYTGPTVTHGMWWIISIYIE